MEDSKKQVSPACYKPGGSRNNIPFAGPAANQFVACGSLKVLEFFPGFQGLESP